MTEEKWREITEVYDDLSKYREIVGNGPASLYAREEVKITVEEYSSTFRGEEARFILGVLVKRRDELKEKFKGL